VGWLRLGHPFPSILDGLVSGTIALVAGGAPDVALRIGLAMTLLQLGIGTVNDLVDAPFDAGRKPGKPIPAGLVSTGAARAVAVALFVGGGLLATSVSAALGGLSLVVIGIGLAYDLRLKGTAWSWLPFAVGIPILPVYGWLGAAGSLPPAFVALIPAAVLAGAALAIGNSLVDVERDEGAGRTSVAARLGPKRATRLSALLVGAVVVIAIGSAALAVVAPNAIAGLAAAGLVAIAATLGGAAGSASRREWAWRLEAVAIGVLGVIWVGAVA
jgi:4-hydroxybenzoate polyprenyltransferase